jgi:hypothetical protein
MARIRKPTRPPMKEGDQTVDTGGNGLTVCVLLHTARIPEVQGYSGLDGTLEVDLSIRQLKSRSCR